MESSIYLLIGELRPRSDSDICQRRTSLTARAGPGSRHASHVSRALASSLLSARGPARSLSRTCASQSRADSTLAERERVREHDGRRTTDDGRRSSHLLPIVGVDERKDERPAPIAEAPRDWVAARHVAYQSNRPRLPHLGVVIVSRAHLELEPATTQPAAKGARLGWARNVRGQSHANLRRTRLAAWRARARACVRAGGRAARAPCGRRHTRAAQPAAQRAP